MAAIKSQTMECIKKNYDIVCEKLKNANSELIRLNSYIVESNNSKTIQSKISSDKIKRLELDIKILEEQHELVISDKFNATKMLSENEARCKDLETKMEELTQENENLKRNVNILTSKVNAFNFEKKCLSQKFHLLKVQENAAGALRSKFDKTVAEFLTKEDLEKSGEAADVESDKSGNSVSFIRKGQIFSTSTTAIVRSSVASGAGQVHAKVTDEERSIGPLVQKVGYKRGLKPVKFTWEPFTRKRISGSRPPRVTTSPESTSSRPKRSLKCSFCSKRYTSSATNAFCHCHYDRVNYDCR